MAKSNGSVASQKQPSSNADSHRQASAKKIPTAAFLPPPPPRSERVQSQAELQYESTMQQKRVWLRHAPRTAGMPMRNPDRISQPPRGERDVPRDRIATATPSAEAALSSFRVPPSRNGAAAPSRGKSALLRGNPNRGRTATSHASELQHPSPTAPTVVADSDSQANSGNPAAPSDSSRTQSTLPVNRRKRSIVAGKSPAGRHSSSVAVNSQESNPKRRKVVAREPQHDTHLTQRDTSSPAAPPDKGEKTVTRDTSKSAATSVTARKATSLGRSAASSAQAPTSGRRSRPKVVRRPPRAFLLGIFCVC